jgi:hypothetical protein
MVEAGSGYKRANESACEEWWCQKAPVGRAWMMSQCRCVFR